MIKNLAKRFEKTLYFVIVKLINFVRCCVNEFIHVSTWMVGRDLMKYHCQRRKNSTVT